MATLLDRYRTKKEALSSQIAANSLPLEDNFVMQELNYRISVLETLQSFCKTSPVTIETKVIAFHFQLVDRYLHFLLDERIYHYFLVKSVFHSEHICGIPNTRGLMIICTLFLCVINNKI